LYHFYVSATIVHWHDPATQAAALYFNRAEVDRSYALRDIRRAHEELQSRTTTGAAIIIP
jgi:hypothetical protein